MDMNDLFGQNTPSLLRVGEVASLLQVSGNTVTRLIRQGKIPAIRVGRCWRIPRDDMARWLDAHSTTGGRDGFR